ncbi:hypothetical protein FHW69_000606 [Luteibacter sp. Sphag1AF]|uniref:hypothetical protein n=1 Tax=Luteibacter sp. Sphag1AF TaxID=2587031 RepID=UPI00160E8103|nr:hypothetical protein [Luteibacter sp. Sphag1AF]MBB3226016.1 hypothetical protein [Luteibacter sp. Sphag1AF]
MNPSDQTIPCPSCHNDVELSNDKLHEAIFMRLSDAVAVLDLMSHAAEADVDPATWARTTHMVQRLLNESRPPITAIWRSKVQFIPAEALAILKAGPFGKMGCPVTTESPASPLPHDVQKDPA